MLGTGPAIAQQPTRPDTAVALTPIQVTVIRGGESLRVAPFALSVVRGTPPLVADPSLSLPAALAAVPGVAAQSRGHAARDEAIAIRGFGARAAFGVRGIRIVLDGIPQTLPDGQSQLTNVNLRRLETIEVLRGAASALHGNATGGVISLQSDRSVPARLLTDARVLDGSNGLVSADARLRVPVAQGFVDLGVARDAASGFRAQSRYEVWRAAMVGRVPAAGTTLGWVLDAGSYPNAEDPGALTAEELAADPRQANPAYVGVNARKSVWQVQSGVTAERPLGSRGQLEAAAFAVRRDLDNQLPFAQIVLGRWAWGGRVVATVVSNPEGTLALTAGGDLQWQRDDRLNRSPDGSGVTRDQLEMVHEIGPFAQLRVMPVRRLTLVAGARYDIVGFAVDDRLTADGDGSGDRTMNAPSGTLGASVEIAQPLVVWGRVGTAFETPTTTELGNTPDGSGGFNPDLEPQKATELEVGARLTTPGFQAGGALFHAAVRDELISYEVPADPGRRYFRNAGRARHRGIELDAAGVLSSAVSLAWTYTLSDLRFTDFATDAATYDGNRIPGVPLHLARVAVIGTVGPLRMEGELRAASKTFADDANTARADAWWVADARLEVHLSRGEWVARPVVGVENLFDRAYVAAVTVNGANGRYYEPAAGRTVYVGLSLRAGERRERR